MANDKDLGTAQHNRRTWDAEADEYQRMHMDSLSDEKAFAWGIWRISENEIGALGDVEGMDMLELGCGAAQWSIALAKRGARVTGLDNSARQLEHAKRLVDEAGVDVTLVLSPAEVTPFDDASFDCILSDYGATLFSDPYATIPECARILRPGGKLVFATTSPLMMACWDRAADELTSQLQQPYFGMHRFDWGYDEPVDFTLPYGEWIRLFRRCGLAIEDLLEVRPPDGAQTTYEGRPLWWATKWPAELIWKVSKERRTSTS